MQRTRRKPKLLTAKTQGAQGINQLNQGMHPESWIKPHSILDGHESHINTAPGMQLQECSTHNRQKTPEWQFFPKNDIRGFVWYVLIAADPVVPILQLII
jgi:hypothetical protein